MAFADNLGGTAASANLPATGGSTTTIEEQRPTSSPESRRVTSPRRNARRCTAAAHDSLADPHHPRDGKLAAIVTQTQLMMTKLGG